MEILQGGNENTKWIYFMLTKIYSRQKKARLNFLRNTQPINQKSEQLWKYIVRPIRDKNDSTLQWRATSTRLSVKKKWMKKCQDLLSMKEQKMTS